MADIEKDINSLPSDDIPPLRMPERGYNGLIASGGQVLEECNRELAWPYCNRTFTQMCKDATVSSGISYVQMAMETYKWGVKAPEGYEDEMGDYVKFLYSIMTDMEHTFKYFITQACSFVPMGYSIHEVVPRVRLKSKGSKHNDGLVGIRKLAFRSQDSIVGWNWKNEGRDLHQVVQQVIAPTNYTYPQDYPIIPITNYTNSVQKIDLRNCIHLRNNVKKDSPVGQSPLVNCWQSWKYKKAYEKVEADGVSQDTQGFKILYIPDQYMRDDATDSDKQIYQFYQEMLRNVKSSFILPNLVNPYKTSEGLFKFEVVNNDSNYKYEIGDIIERYKKEILTCLHADFLVVGQDGAGSMALSESKKEVLQLVAENKLAVICDELNHKLIPLIFELNGWETSVYPEFYFFLEKEDSLLDYSTAMYRFLTAGAIPIKPQTINEILARVKSKYRVDGDVSTEELRKILSGKQQTATNRGVSDEANGSDNSATNANNV